MSWVIFVICGICVIIYYLGKDIKGFSQEVKDAQKTTQIVLHPLPTVTGIPIRTAQQNVFRAFLKEFEYTQEIYSRMSREFRRAHPIGSIYVYTSNYGLSGGGNAETLLILNSQDQRKAFELEYRATSDPISDSGAYIQALSQARLRVLHEGFLPDNLAPADSQAGFYKPTDTMHTSSPLIFCVMGGSYRNNGKMVVNVFPSALNYIHWGIGNGCVDEEKAAAYREDESYKSLCLYLRWWDAKQNQIASYHTGIPYTPPEGWNDYSFDEVPIVRAHRKDGTK